MTKNDVKCPKCGDERRVIWDRPAAPVATYLVCRRCQTKTRVRDGQVLPLGAR
jgi:hypothetical protein